MVHTQIKNGKYEIINALLSCQFTVCGGDCTFFNGLLNCNNNRIIGSFILSGRRVLFTFNGGGL